MPDPLRLMAVLAHPDDESLGCGGTLAKYAAEGVATYLVTATLGERGWQGDPADDPGLAALARVREAELRCAVAILGIRELALLGYIDGDLDQANPVEAAGKIAAHLRRLRPQVVITFDPTGGYGHPDHIAIHTHTAEAFHAAGDATRYPNQGDAWQPERLLYSVIPRSTLRAWRDEMAARGEDTSQFDSPEGQAMGWPDEEVHLYLDVIDYIPNKWAAFQCHATQFGDDSFFDGMPDDQRQLALGREAFVQAWPPLEPGDRLTDLFPSE